MDNGARFVLDNFEKSLNICRNYQEFNHLKRKINYEYNIIKYIKTTGNMVEHFDKFADGKHKYANDFTGLQKYGILTNEELSTYLRKNYKDELNNIKTIDDIKVGSIISHAEIHIYLGGSTQGAVVRRNKKKNIFILVLDNKHNTFNPNGIISFNYQGAKAKIDESKNLLKYKELNSKIYAFKQVGKNKYKYLGLVNIGKYQGSINGNKYIELIPITNTNPTSNTPTVINDAKDLPEPTTKEVKEVKVNQFKRNQKVVDETKRRANGKCDLCGEEAPFNTIEGEPYLECHHVIYIANNGPDRIYNTVALCPNCHKKIHILGDTEDKNKLINKIEYYLTSNQDKQNLERFKKLFGLK